jgi:glycosyltransferase involved in cell wall biosynthesis
MGYYNRKEQIFKTVQSIADSVEKGEVELVIIDDGSSVEQQLSIPELVQYSNLKFNITLQNFKTEEKTWVNPCIAYNKAISLAQGDIIMLQNPECMHVGNVLKYVKENLKKYQYMAFSCLSWDQSEFNLEAAKAVNFPAAGQCQLGWYHHPTYNNRPFHFCCALHKENLTKLRGFDERFKDGPCYDDVDFVRRVQTLGLQIVSPTDPFVVHQWHESGHIYQSDSHQRFLNNQKIYGDILSGALPSWS